MRSATFQPWPRIAWLMLSVRMMGHDTSLVHREALLDRLREQGLAVDLSRISRWESGRHPVPGRVLLAYETILGQTPGSLLAISRGLVRVSSATPSLPEPYTDDVVDSSKDIDTLLDQALAGSSRTGTPVLTGGEWLRLAIELGRFQPVYLQSRVWAELCGRLVHELARTSGIDCYLRYEACFALVAHPVAKRPMLRALGEWLTDPDVQISHPMIALLGEIPDEAAGELVIRLLGSQIPVLAQGAVSVAAAKLARGHLGLPTIVLVEQYVARRLASEGRATPDVIDLLAQLPVESSARLVAKIADPLLRRRLEQTLEEGSLAPADLSRSTARGIVAQAQRDTPSPFRHEPDRMLHALVTEALFHTHGMRRNMAARTLAVSPYHSAIADSCLALARGGDPLLASRGLAVAFRLDRGSRHDELLELSLTDSRTGFQASDLVVLGLERPSSAPAPRNLTAAGAGNTSSALQLARPDGAAAWWRDLGPALHD